MIQVGRYSKFIVAVLGVASTVLTTYYSNVAWVPAAVSALAAAGVLLVPNQAPAPPVAAVEPSNVKTLPPAPPPG